MFSLGRPRPGSGKSQRRHCVQWRVGGRDRTRAFETRAEADRYRSGLLLAVQEGQPFERGTGQPVAWVEHGRAPSWWSWSREWLALKRPQWSGHTRRSAVETLTLLAPQLVPAGAPAPPEDLGDWLRKAGYRPGSPTEGPTDAWLARWSLPLTDIDPANIERALQAVCVKADGTPTVPSVARRRRGTLGAVLRAAVRRELLATNPMEPVEWRAPTTTMAIDVTTVPAPSDVEAVVDHVAALASSGARYAVLFAAVGMAGMRPSEAIALRVQDLDLPKKGWGLASLRGAVTSPGTRYTGDGAVVEAKGLKHRAVGTTREVPLSPGLVRRLRGHFARVEPVDAQVFTNAAGRPPTSTTTARSANAPEPNSGRKVTRWLQPPCTTSATPQRR